MKYALLPNIGYKGCIVLFKLTVQNSQSSDPTVAKLLEADADLAVQEVELAAQLQSVQEKRHSLKTVINLFTPVDSTIKPVATPKSTPVAPKQVEAITQTPVDDDVAEHLVQKMALAELDDAVTITVEAAPQPQKSQGKKNSSSSSNKPGKKTAPTKEPSEAANGWQQYLREAFVDASLAEAVAEAVQQHSDKVLEITAILDIIFVDEIPKEMRSTARERVSNVLSVGAKKGKWYRGELGKYSMSKTAVEEGATGQKG